MSTSSPPDGQRRANTALVMMWVSITALIINVVGATTFWLSLPEKLKAVNAALDTLNARMTLQESKSATQDTVMARVDERTKTMQEDVRLIQTDVRQLHQDFFSFRASASPTK